MRKSLSRLFAMILVFAMVITSSGVATFAESLSTDANSIENKIVEQQKADSGEEKANEILQESVDNKNEVIDTDGKNEDLEIANEQTNSGLKNNDESETNLTESETKEENLTRNIEPEDEEEFVNEDAYEEEPEDDDLQNDDAGDEKSTLKDVDFLDEEKNDENLEDENKEIDEADDLSDENDNDSFDEQNSEDDDKNTDEETSLSTNEEEAENTEPANDLENEEESAVENNTGNENKEKQNEIEEEIDKKETNAESNYENNDENATDEKSSLSDDIDNELQTNILDENIEDDEKIDIETEKDDVIDRDNQDKETQNDTESSIENINNNENIENVDDAEDVDNIVNENEKIDSKIKNAESEKLDGKDSRTENEKINGKIESSESVNSDNQEKATEDEKIIDNTDISNELVNDESNENILNDENKAKNDNINNNLVNANDNKADNNSINESDDNAENEISNVKKIETNTIKIDELNINKNGKVVTSTCSEANKLNEQDNIIISTISNAEEVIYDVEKIAACSEINDKIKIEIATNSIINNDETFIFGSIDSCANHPNTYIAADYLRDIIGFIGENSEAGYYGGTNNGTEATNCTYVAYKLAQIWDGISLAYYGNAKNWYNRAMADGYMVTNDIQNVSPPCLFVQGYGLGHVGYIDYIYPDRYVHTLEGGVNRNEGGPPRGSYGYAERKASLDRIDNNFIGYIRLRCNATFDVQGHGVAPEMQKCKYYTQIIEPVAPNEPGFVFGGWFKEPECINSWDFNTTISRDITLYAKWTNSNEVRVTFNTNGGSVINDKMVTKNTKVERPTNPTKSGFDFVDWYSDSALTNVFDFNTLINSDIVLYAKWLENGTWTDWSEWQDEEVLESANIKVEQRQVPASYIMDSFVCGVSGYPRGFYSWNKGSIRAEYHEEWEASKFDNATIYHEGDYYDYWDGTYYDGLVGGGGNAYVSNPGWIPFYVREIKYKTQYRYSTLTMNQYTVTFNTNGGSIISSKTVSHGDKVAKPNNPTKKGYSFVNWYKESTFKNVWNFNTDVVKNNITLYAKWEQNQYTVTFNTNGGSVISSIKVFEGNKIIKPNNPTKNGYTFVNWYKESTFKNVWNFNTDVVKNNITLYAKWEQNQYTVTFNTNGGSAISSIKLNEGSKIAKPSNPTKKGYSFVNWYKESTFKNVWNFNTDVVKNNITLYAKW